MFNMGKKRYPDPSNKKGRKRNQRLLRKDLSPTFRDTSIVQETNQLYKICVIGEGTFSGKNFRNPSTNIL